MGSSEPFLALREDDDPSKRAERWDGVSREHLLTCGSHSHHSENPEGQKKIKRHFQKMDD